MVHVLRDDSFQYSGGYSLIEDVIFELGVENSFDVGEPFDEIVLVFEVLWQFYMHGGIKSFEDDKEEFGGLVIKIGETLFKERLKFGEVVVNEIVEF